MTIAAQIKRGSAELAILALLENQALHGYAICQRIERESKGLLKFDVASLYPLLYRMERKKWVKGAWQTASNGRRRRCYQLTEQGRKKLAPLREQWRQFFVALDLVAGVGRA